MEPRGWEDCSDFMSRPEDWQEGGGEGCEGAGGGEAPAADQEEERRTTAEICNVWLRV